VTFWGWVKKVGWGLQVQPSSQLATLPDFGRDRKLASVLAQRAMGWVDFENIAEKVRFAGKVKATHQCGQIINRVETVRMKGGQSREIFADE
jgi:hypothetical protein